MRRFEDGRGHLWDVVVGRESWGAFFAIFVPGPEGGAVRETALAAESWEDAERALDDMDPAALRDLLERSNPKQLE